MIPLKALWRIDVAARKQESSTAVALVRLLGWGVAMGLWWWLGAITDEQVLLVIAGVEAVAALLQAILPDRFGASLASSKHELHQHSMELPPHTGGAANPTPGHTSTSGWNN